MDTLLTPFKYKHFEARRDIRLLKLQPAPALSSDLHGEIFHEGLHSSMQPYDALSYTWGSNQQTHQLFVDGKKLAITNNLDSALRRLRFKHDSRVIWVDAICINQTNIPEKNVQVPLMREIYEFASKTVVWFGEEGDAQIGLEFLKVLQDKLYEPWKGFDPWAAGNLKSGSDGFTALGERPHSEPCWKWFTETIAFEHGIKTNPEAIAVALDYKRKWDAVSNLFKRPWWERIWVIQEVAHVGIIRAYIGSIDMSFDTLVEYYTRFDRLKKRQVALQKIGIKARRAEATIMGPVLGSLKELLEECRLTTDSPQWKLKMQDQELGEMQAALKEVQAAIEQQRQFDHLIERLKALKTERAAVVAIHSLRRDAVILGRNEMPRANLDLMAVFRDASPKFREHALRRVEEDDRKHMGEAATILRQYCKRLDEGRGEAADREAQAAFAALLHFDFPVSLAGDRYAVPHSDLLENMWNFRDQGASDWRDKVYALLGMSQDYLDIDVDYSAKVASADVFKATTRGLIEKSRKLDVLTGVGSRLKAEMPSWILDLSTPATYHSRVMFSLRKSFSATKKSLISDNTRTPRFDRSIPVNDLDTILLRGQSIGIVTKVSDSELTLEAEHNDDNITLFQYASPFTQLPHGEVGQQSSTPFNTSWGPSGMIPGDEIVLFVGGSVPFVIRQESIHQVWFSLIGACLLIDGELTSGKDMLDGGRDPGYSDIMFGSAWDEESQGELHDFLLR